jgi:hypothetical protein
VLHEINSVESLDDFKNLEVMDAVFSQCDAGDYETLINKSVAAGSSSVTGSSSSGGGSSSSSSAYTSVDRSSELVVVYVNDKYGARLFETQYNVGGLVLDTEFTMGLVSDFIMDIYVSREQKLNELGFLGVDKVNEGGKARAAEPLSSGRVLMEHLKKNRNMFSGLRILQRCVEAQWRFGFDAGFEEESAEIGRHYHEIIQNILVNVLSSRSIDQSLALGLTFALPMDRAFQCIKNSLGITGSDSALSIKIANVAIVVATVWGQRGFQVQCQAHATNAKWYHQFRLFGIAYEERAFGSGGDTSYKRSFVCELLSKSSMDLFTALEFARNYNIEGMCNAA